MQCGYRYGTLFLLTAGTCATRTAQAQHALDMQDKAFVEAAVVVMAYDLFATRCAAQSAFTEDEARRTDVWQRQNEAPLLRRRMAVLERDEPSRVALAKSRAVFEQKFAGVQGRTACLGAVSVTQQPGAQIASSSPALVQALRDGAAAAGTVATAGGAAPRSAPPASSPQRAESSAALARRIDSFGFDTRPEMGMGGFIGIKVYPVVLFRDGSALTDVGGLGFAGGIDANRQAEPKRWTRWRRSGGTVQLQKDGKWDDLEFQRTYGTLPADFRLEGRFRRSSGTGNVAVGGSQSVTVVSTFLFARDGRVVRDASVGSTGSAGDVSVATSQASPSQRGRYTIDGITLRIRYDDGHEESRILVTDPTDPKSVIWLDGDSYVRR